MDFTSTTEIARKGSKIFQTVNYTTVLHNNKDIGVLIGGDLYRRIKNSRYFEDMLEDIEMSKNRENLQKQMQESADSGRSNLVI